MRRTAARTDRIAFYGSLRAGTGVLRRLGVLRLLRSLGPCRLPGRLVDLGRYPGLVRGPGSIAAELFEVRHPRALAVLDRFEDCDPARPRRSMYRRIALSPLDRDGPPAWVYLYNRPAGGWPAVPDGDWLAHLDRRRLAGRGGGPGFSSARRAR
ncbi:MAG: gamma-glutamylcyclotransferase [Alphaproteobacteria bacterium]